MDEARAVELETRLAYQEALLRDLNDVIARQQKQIERLEQICRSLAETSLRAARNQAGTLPPEEEVPPHW